MKRIFVCWLGFALAAPALAPAQELPSQEPPSRKLKYGLAGPSPAPDVPPPPPYLTFTITAQPALLPAPALRYLLLPEYKDLTSGNALTKYYKAFSLEWWDNIQRQDSKWHEAADQALEAPLDKMPLQYAFVKNWKMLQEVDGGARMDHCDWDLIGRLKEGGYATTLPDAQSLRTVARFLALRIRYEIAAGEFDKAIESLQTGFALARHVGEGPTLIHMLIGVAISQMMTKQMDELIQHPKCPNLYWALSRLPRPYFDMSRPIGGELLISTLIVPEFEELRKGLVKPERAQSILDAYIQRSRAWGLTTLKPEELTKQLLVIYPKAKAALIAKGQPPAEVEAMTAAQVVLLHSTEEFLRLRDDICKWVPLPVVESDANLQKAVEAVLEAQKRGDTFPEMLEAIMGGVKTSRYAAARADRRFAMLRIVEAIRLYAAQNDGKLPARLTDMSELPVPLDLMTGKPFEYSVKDGTASISGPAIAGMNAKQAMVYRVTIKK